MCQEKIVMEIMKKSVYFNMEHFRCLSFAFYGTDNVIICAVTVHEVIKYFHSSPSIYWIEAHRSRQNLFPLTFIFSGLCCPYVQYLVCLYTRAISKVMQRLAVPGLDDAIIVKITSVAVEGLRKKHMYSLYQ